MADFIDDPRFFSQMKENLLNAFETDQLTDDDKSAIDQLWIEACQQ